MYSIYRSAIYKFSIFTVSLLLVSFLFIADAMAQYAAVQVINIAGGGEVTLSAKNVSNNAVASQGRVSWSSVTAGSPGWKIADQYIEISHHDLPVLWGMQICTDNTNITANPRYAGTADPAGLVSTDNNIMALPMIWRISDHVLSAAELTSPVERPNATGFTDYLWHYLKDKKTPDKPYTAVNEAFVNGSEYVTIWNQAGIAWNEGGRAMNPKKAYVYFAAKFQMATPGVNYSTSKLIVEAYHEGISPFPLYIYKDAPLTDFPAEPGATLENHFAPSGWMNYNELTKNIKIDPKCKEVTPHSGTHCFKITWDGSDGSTWGGIMWLEPETIWETGGVSTTHNGYDLRDADYVSFWARTNVANQGVELQSWFGNSWDSCGAGSAEWRAPSLTINWQRFLIPVSGKDMSNVTGGLGIIFAADHDPDPDGCIIYLDDIKYDRY